MSKTILAAAVCGLLTGCMSSEIVWTKRGSNFSAEEVRGDASECRVRAENVPGTVPVRLDYAYRTCMRGKGWYQIEIPVSIGEVRS